MKNEELIKKVIDCCILQPCGTLIHRYEDYGERQVLENIFFKVRNVVAGNGPTPYEQIYKKVEELRIFDGEKITVPEPIKQKKTEVQVDKPIPVDESKQRKSPEEIIKLQSTKIKKIITLYQAGYSCEFISKFGRENGWLAKYYTPKEVEWNLKNKGIIER